MKTHISQGYLRWGCWTNVREILRCAQDDKWLSSLVYCHPERSEGSRVHVWIITKGAASDKAKAYLPGCPGGL